MSDFGSIMVLKPQGKDFFDEEEKETIKIFIENLKENEYREPNGGEPYTLAISESSDKFEVIMSEYWFGDGDDDENFEFAQELDEINMDEVKKYFEENLDVKIDFEFLFLKW